jgi:hypothetical protein
VLPLLQIIFRFSFNECFFNSHIDDNIWLC